MCCLQTITGQYLQQLSTGMTLSLSPNRASKTGTLEQITKVVPLPSLVAFDAKTELHCTKLRLAVLPNFVQVMANSAYHSMIQ